MTEHPGRKTVLFLVLVLVLAASNLLAENIKNWSAPATWSPTKSHGGVSAQDLTNPLPFIALAPCRIVDTRGLGAPIQGGVFTGGADVRNYDITGICGVPASAHAVSLNFTVTPPGQTVPGFLTAWPTGGAIPPVSILNWDHVPAQIANAAVMPLSSANSFTVNVSAPTHVIVDVNGYYYDGLLSGNPSYLPVGAQFIIGGEIAGGTIVYGENRSTTNGSRGIRGVASGASGITYGVLGQTSSSTNGAVGVRGEVAGSLPNAFFGTIGVQGVDAGGAGGGFWGVLGLSFGGRGVQGSRTDSAGAPLTSGVLGYTGNSGVHSFNDTTAGGTKFFIQPHPTDASKQIAYVSLEGNEAGTYFRGRGRFVNGKAVIPVPEDFQMVTEDDGLTVQITPLGRMAQVGVISMDLNHVVAESSRDVEFSYLVQGVRRGYANLKPIQDNVYFVPSSADARMDPWPQQTRDTLIRLGIYNADGTVNMETAERVGWARVWREKAERSRAEAAARALQPAERPY